MKINRYLKNLISNLSFLLRKNILSELKFQLQKINLINFEFVKRQTELEQKIVVLKILNYYLKYSNLGNIYQKELLYLENNNTPTEYPYKRLKFLNNIVSGFDKQLLLPFVIHNDKKIFFPTTYTEEKAINYYKGLIEIENILGGNYCEKCPHQDESEFFSLKEGSLLLDVGCAEGLFALHSINKVSKIILVESDQAWLKPLEATFAPYKDKVTIINKLLSDTDTDKSIMLSSIILEEITNQIFIKMDIEGYETTVIKSSREILSKQNNITFACCTYHKQNDAEELQNIFESLNYKVEFSDGFLLFFWDNEPLMPPYFRKGIIRAKRSS